MEEGFNNTEIKLSDADYGGFAFNSYRREWSVSDGRKPSIEAEGCDMFSPFPISWGVSTAYRYGVAQAQPHEFPTLL